MKRVLCVAFFLGVWLVSSVVAAHFWVTRPDMFPTLPQAFWRWADAYYQAGNGEELADLELIVTFCISAIFILLMSLLSYMAWRKFLVRR